MKSFQGDDAKTMEDESMKTDDVIGAVIMTSSAENIPAAEPLGYQHDENGNCSSENPAPETQQNNGEKTRRRKGGSKPRRISPDSEPPPASDCDQLRTANHRGARAQTLDQVLLKVLGSSNKQRDDCCETTTAINNNKMIDVHEALVISHRGTPAHHSPKSPPVESLYAAKSSSDAIVTSSPDPFVKREQVEHDQDQQQGARLYHDAPVTPQLDSASSGLLPPPQENGIDRGADFTPQSNSPVDGYRSPPEAISRSPGAAVAPASASPSANHAAPTYFVTSPAPYPVASPNSASAASRGAMPLMLHDSAQQQQKDPQFRAFPGAANAEKSPPSNKDAIGPPGAIQLLPPRGLVGMGQTEQPPPGGAPMDASQYKRPPHTYPALIASAILDSPGRLVTLRGIYDYIMNNFPYYKYCHDKSAWQNSIRHNLSLNQCFVKVPRYENAAKSNYWTMTREGFEEFGNENSFKRRRRRGASLAPISAYKAKKYQNDANKAASMKAMVDGNRAAHHVTTAATGNDTAAAADPAPAAPPAYGGFPFPPQLMALTAGHWPGHHPGAGGHLPQPGADFQQQHAAMTSQRDEESRKRSGSFGEGDESAGGGGVKHPRMVVLKQGEGPVLRDGDEPKRPNSLSSVEEMQGALNTFSKSLIDHSKGQGKGQQGMTPLLAASAHPWFQHQKNLIANSGMLMPGLISCASNSSVTRSSPDTSGKIQQEDSAASPVNNHQRPVVVDGIKAGSEVAIRGGGGDDKLTSEIRHFRCRFCPYTYVGASPLLLEQHVRVLHHIELANHRVKIKQPAAVGQQQQQEKLFKSKGDLMRLPGMVSGMSPRGAAMTSQVMAAHAHSNAQSLIAAAAAQHSTGNGGGNFPYTASFASGLLDEQAMRSVSEQQEQQQQQQSVEAYAFQRQQALNNAIQQAAAASTVTSQQDHLRLFYQQLAMQNPLLSSNPLANYPAQMTSAASADSEQLKHNIWQYQQKLIELSQLKQASSDQQQQQQQRHDENPAPPSANPPVSKACESPSSDGEAGSERKMDNSVHAWKKCERCDFTAKGAHGLELHQRKAHASAEQPVSPPPPNQPRQRSPLATSSSVVERKLSSASASSHQQQRESPPTTSPHAYPTPPQSNSPSRHAHHRPGPAHHNHHFTPLDLSRDSATRSTQTDVTTSTSTLACRHCDVAFGDEMMHALHMSCHDKHEPFRCTICGQHCHEKYYFNVHLLRGLHQPQPSTSSTSGGDVITNGSGDSGDEGRRERSRPGSDRSGEMSPR